MNDKKRIVVIGGGFAGLNFIKKIDKRIYDVTLIDRNNYHSFPPLFYQVASSGLEPGSICFPLRREIRKGKAKGTHFQMWMVSAVDMTRKVVMTEDAQVPFDKLVIAAGTTNNFFGNDELIKRVFTLKSTAQAIRTRNEILDRLERASNMKSSEARQKLLSFVVVGGGPTGVEIAGALGEMKRYIVKREYPNIKPEEVKITLLEGSGKLLGAMSLKSQLDAKRYLEDLMVDIRLNTLMKDYNNNTVILNDGGSIYSGVVIWTAGITAVPFEFVGLQPQKGRGGRLLVDSFNRVTGLENVYALGDICLMTTKDYPAGHPQLAQVAIQQGRLLAKNLNRNDKKYTPFVYKDMGSMATVGRNRAVADLSHGSHLSGWVAWMTWMIVHLISLLGMRNKISVLVDWITNYFSYGTSIRLLLHPARYPLRWRWGEK